MSGTLVICATPIGNLGDVSTRLAEELEAADLILAEDTRRTGALLNHLGVATPMKSYFAGNERGRNDELAELLGSGLRIALVSDAGTPVVSDPGASAVRRAVSVGAEVTAIPGPSAAVTALSVSGFAGDRFVFDGFLPRKGSERTEAIDGIASERRTVVVFAAKSRVAKDLADLAAACGVDRKVVVARELTKLHEEIFRGTLGEAVDHVVGTERGEYCVVIEGAPHRPPDIDEAVQAVQQLIGGGESTSDAVREIAGAFGVSRRALYERVIAGVD